MSKVIRVSEDSYKQIARLMSERGVGLQEAADFLIQQSPNGAEDQDSSALLDVLREQIAEKDISSPEALRESLRILFEALEFYRAAKGLFLCEVCGKPIPWEPNEAWIQWIRQRVQGAGLHHNSCKK